MFYSPRSHTLRDAGAAAGAWTRMLSLCTAIAASVSAAYAQGPVMAPSPSLRPLTAPATVDAASPAALQRVLPTQGQVPLKTVQNRDPRRPLPRQIAKMPQAQEKLEVIDQRSQLIVTNDRVAKTAIADPSIIDIVQYSPTEFSVIGLVQGKTNMLLWFEGEKEPLIYEVSVIPDPDLEEQRQIDYGRLERKLAILFPNSKVYLIPMSRKIIVKGQARDGEEAAQILQVIRGEILARDGRFFGPQPANNRGNLNNRIGTGLQGVTGGGLGGGLAGAFGDDIGVNQFSSLIVNMLEVPGEYQIMLRVRIAELARSQLRQKGVDLNVLFNNARHAVTSTLGGAAGTLTGIFENGEVTVLINWLESNGTAKILSEPTLTVLSGHSASFLSGAEFAVPTIVGINGAQGQTTTFRGFGTSIICTPTVVDRDLIRMRIVPEFSEANQGLAVGGIPGLNSRRVQTTVELREGQTIAIAGLISHQMNTEITRIPFLGEIPYIGPRLFAAKRASQDETELLVLVTPEIVRPMDAEEVPPVPGYEVTHPNHWELYHAAMSEGAPDTGYYQVPPLGSDSNRGINVPFRWYAPAPAAGQYAPVPTQGAAPMAPGIDPTSYNWPGGSPRSQQVAPVGYNRQLPSRNGAYLR